MTVNVHLGDEQGLDRSRRYLRPVARLQLPDEPDLVHLAVYEWLPMFDAWATGPAICGRSTAQGPLTESVEATCASCLAYEPKYRTALDRQAGVMRTTQVPAASLEEHVAATKYWFDAADERRVERDQLRTKLKAITEATILWRDRTAGDVGLAIALAGILDAEAPEPPATAALARVRKLHRPVLYTDPVDGQRSQQCAHCSDHAPVLYPCDTVRAIEERP
ncbi:hypothetical protein [Streptomyces sparsogenes]|uniref:Uncharacterized protein n=1 Tax=Streptomyces sparsogenes DSM 40356 TaxID=1331668 RepID=A0A1R1S7U2_9ACTN|nr:hypothetical protein [Streptomyces sparsogenes]OMI34350.1 hypothetical protein SPAR_36241 [Streptomyces sparsogenes DSM 40356]